MLTSSRAIIPTAGIDRTVAFCAALGFVPECRWDDRGSLIFNKYDVEVRISPNPNRLTKTSGHAPGIHAGYRDGRCAELTGTDRLDDDGFPNFVTAADRPGGTRQTPWRDPDGDIVRRTIF